MHALSPLAISMPQGAEWLVILALGLLIFGKRLPDVGKGIGQAIGKFKEGLRSSETEIEQVEEQTAQPAKLSDAEGNPQRRFDPYTGKPITAS